MADPLTGLASVVAVSSILSVIDFSTKVISQATKLARSTNNALDKNLAIERLTQESGNLAKHIVSDLDNKRPLTAAEQAVDNLAQECRSEAQALLNTLSELKIEKDLKWPVRALQSAKQASKAVMKRNAIVRQKEYLESLQERLSNMLLNILRTTQATHLEAIIDRIDDFARKTASEILHSRNAILQEIQLLNKVPDEKASSIIDSLSFSDMRQRRDAIPEAYQGTFEWIFQNIPPHRFLAGSGLLRMSFGLPERQDPGSRH